MTHRFLMAAALAATTFIAAPPVQADLMGGWNRSADGGGACQVHFTRLPGGVEAEYIGTRNGELVKTKVTLPANVDMSAIAAVLGNTNDCSSVSVSGT